MYLLIQNKGVAPVQAYTLLGASNTRNSQIEGTIGKFGTGAKHAISTLLRAGLKIRVYCGKTRLDFRTKPEVVEDDLSSETHQRVYVKYGGTSTKTEDLGWTLNFGSLDWTNLGMSLREFVSNALDRTIREHGDFIPSIENGDLCVKVVDTIQAKSGYTRIYIELDSDGDILRYLSELPKRFLHFSKDPSQVKMGLLPKGRNLSDSGTPMIYREGVFVSELRETQTNSFYDYNFKDSEINIDDCRNSNEYSIRAACARRLRKASETELTPLFRALHSDMFEAGLDSMYLMSSWDTPTDEQKNNWHNAWKNAFNESIAADIKENDVVIQHAARKGYKVHKIPSMWANVIGKFGIITTTQILSENERNGRKIVVPTQAALDALDEVWEWIEAAHLTNDKEKPGIACYKDLTNAESDMFGFYQPGDNKIHIREDIASGRNKYLLKAVLEELTHYITGSRDLSRDFQNFFMDMIVDYLA